MHHDRWVAIDFETATNEANSACALGVAVIEGLEIIETRSWLIQPPANEYFWACTNVHGITAEDTAQSPEFDELWPEFEPYLSAGQLLAHNAPFDTRVLGALLHRHDLELPMTRVACTVRLARKAFPVLPNHKLNTVCDACGIRLQHHDAGSDALACALVAIACANHAGTGSVSEAIEGLGVRVTALGGGQG